MAGIGDLVANLSVNSAPFTKGLNVARGSLRSFAGGISGLVGPVAGALAGVWGASSAISGAKESLAAQQKLSAVLASTGGAAGLTTQEISDYAAELQRVTNFEDDATIGAAAMLASLQNVKGDNFKQAMALSQDMATVMGTDLAGATKKLGKELKGLSADEVTAKLAEMQKRFGGAAMAVADPWTQLQNTLGDVGENIGTLLLPSINVLSESLTGMFGIVAGGGEWFKSLGIEAAVVLSNMGGLLTLAFTQWELFFVQIGLEAAHFFTEALPAYFNWFRDNWQNIFVTGASNALTVFENLATNIQSAWQAVLDFFQGKPIQFDWKPLNEGFINTIENLPDVPTRLTTDFEKSLQVDIESMSTHLGAEMDKQRAELTEKFSPAAKVPSFSADDDAGVKSDKSKKTELKAAFKGSQEAASIALRGVGGHKTEKTAEKSLSVQQQMLLAIKDINVPELIPVDF